MLAQNEKYIVRTALNDFYPMTTRHTEMHAQQPTLGLQVGSCLDPGTRRRARPNEDTLLVLQEDLHSRLAQPFVLLVVADGMGGQEHGQEASQLATHCLTDSIENAICSRQQTPETLQSLLVEGMQAANRALYQRNQQQGTRMGTTMTAVLVSEATAYVVHVGDSRLYGYRQATGLVQITRDHSYVSMLVAAGIITPDEIYTHPQRNQIFRSLGTNAEVEADVFAISLHTDDILLVCSDGLWEMVRDQQIATIVQTSPFEPADMASLLLQAALAGGGNDNISAIVARVVKTCE